MVERHSEYERDEHDHYVEPAWCVDVLLAAYPEELSHGIFDPCAGLGTIPDRAILRGFPATGADLIDRANGRFPVQDFLTDHRERPSIVTNPPFKIAVAIVQHALSVVPEGGIVAVIAQAKFLFSQARHPLFSNSLMERVIIFSRRPSMPTGAMLAEHGEACRGGGAMDYAWMVWRVGKTSQDATIEWTLG